MLLYSHALSTELYVLSTYRIQRSGMDHLVFSAVLDNKYKQEQGLLWLLKGYLAADGKVGSQTRGEGHPWLKATRVVQRNIKLHGWKEH